MRKVMIVPTVLMRRSQISEKPNANPTTTQASTIAVAARKAQREPTALAMVLANFRNLLMRGSFSLRPTRHLSDIASPPHAVRQQADHQQLIDEWVGDPFV
jgi:hypothetical protein